MKKLTNLALLFKSLSDENRLKIIELVYKRNLKCAFNQEGECNDQTCIKDLTKNLNISLPTVSHHVKELVNAGLLTTKKRGRWLYLKINSKYFKEIVDFLSIFKKSKI